MVFIASLLHSFVGGTIALLSGIENSVRCRTIRSSYIHFGVWFLILTFLGYVVLSATMLSILPITFVLFLGPLLGPVALMAFCFMSCVTLFLLWVMGRFPKTLFVGRFGVLRPFFSVSQMAFLLASLLMPMGCDDFMLTGIDAIYREKEVDVSTIRLHYKRIGILPTIWLACSNAAFGVVLKAAAFVVTLGMFRSAVDTVVTSFVLGSQLASVYTVRVRGKSFLAHVSWCAKNSLRIVGYTLPLLMIQGCFGWVGTFMSLGLGYSAASALVEELVLEDVMKLDKEI